MAFIGFEQVPATGGRRTVADLNVPVGTNWVELQAYGGDIRYWMGGDPVAGGMGIVDASVPKQFPIDDLNDITWTSDGVDCLLLLHYAS